MASWLGRTAPKRPQRVVENKIKAAGVFYFTIVAEEATSLTSNSFGFSLGDRDLDSADYGVTLPVACTLTSVAYACAESTAATLRIFLDGSTTPFIIDINGVHGIVTSELEISSGSYISIKTASVTTSGSGVRLTLLFRSDV
jgi:hypothetical protein